MIAVLFEVYPTESGREEYLRMAEALKLELREFPGLISIERFESLVEEGKLLSLSIWKDEESLAIWRNLLKHREAQSKGKKQLFSKYRIRVCSVLRDYTESVRAGVPEDSQTFHD